VENPTYVVQLFPRRYVQELRKPQHTKAHLDTPSFFILFLFEALMPNFDLELTWDIMESENILSGI